MLTAALIAGVLGLGSFLSVSAGKEEAEEQQDRIDEQMGINELELAAQKADAFQRADRLEDNAEDSFSLTMGDLFIGQESDEAAYLDLLASGSAALSAQSAAAGLSGIRNTGSTAMLAEQASSELGRKASLARDTIDASRSLSMRKASTALSAARADAADLRDDFASGSAYMNLWNAKQDALQNAYDDAEYSFLDWAGDAVAGAMGGFNLVSKFL